MNELLKELAKLYAEWDNDEKTAKERKDGLKKQILELVGNRPFKNNFMTVSITPEGTTESADKERMIADGIWEKYLKKSPRAGSAKIAVKVEKINEFVAGEGFKENPKFNQEKEVKPDPVFDSLLKILQPENIDISGAKSYDKGEENQSKDCSDDTGIND